MIDTLKRLGWVLDLYRKDGQMVIWLKALEERACLRLADVGWKPRIHVSGDFSDLLELASQPFMTGRCSLVEKYVKPGDSEPSRVLEVEVKSETEADVLARRVQRYGSYRKFKLYDVDVSFSEMYLYQKGLFPLAFVEVDFANGEVRWTLKDSRESIEYRLPPLRKLRLKVKTKTLCSGRIRRFEDALDSIEVACDGAETARKIDSGEEAEKLLDLVDVFHDNDPDVVLTDGGDSFIFPYLARLAQRTGVAEKLILDREGMPLAVRELDGHSYFSYGKVLYRQTAARLLGRLHVDEGNAFFVSGCGLEGLFEVARTCIITLQRASRTTIGTSMTSLQLYHAVKEGILIPWNKSEPEEFKNGNELLAADRGGFIFEPKIGIHDDVGELDFSSLYPMIMMKKNLSGETVNCKCCPNSLNRIPELGFHICEKWIGIVPKSLEILLRKRVLYKKFKKETPDPPTKLMYDQRQAALKWILVCS